MDLRRLLRFALVALCLSLVDYCHLDNHGKTHKKNTYAATQKHMSPKAANKREKPPGHDNACMNHLQRSLILLQGCSCHCSRTVPGTVAGTVLFPVLFPAVSYSSFMYHAFFCSRLYCSRYFSWYYSGNMFLMLSLVPLLARFPRFSLVPFLRTLHVSVLSCLSPGRGTRWCRSRSAACSRRGTAGSRAFRCKT